MKQVFLKRGYMGGDCTLGMLYIENEFHPPLYTLEEPWAHNKQKLSCIPAGSYVCVPHVGTRFKDVWRLLDVPNRTAILIHAGNTTDDIEGCILVGTTHGRVRRKHAVLNSQVAINMLRDIIGTKNSFRITIS